MTIASITMLDQAELLSLALSASAGDDAGSSIVYLKEAVSRADASAHAHYLLGAEYAQIKMYDRAADEMEAALALDPAMSIVRLQLGLLCLTGGNPARAAAVLTGLDDLPASDALNRFGCGLQHLMRDEFADAVRCLREGIALNTSNGPLNGDMQMLIATVEALPAAADAAAAPASEEELVQRDEMARHRMLSAYTGNEAN